MGRSQRRDAGESGFETRPGAVRVPPVVDVGHVERIGAFDREDVSRVIEIFRAALAQFLHHDVLGAGDPGRQLEPGQV